MVKLLFAISIFILVCNSIYSQDIHFSQYKQAPLLLNPALTASNKGDWRAGLNYREQWTRTAIPYTTFNMFFDKKVFFYSKTIMTGAFITVDQLNAEGLTKIILAPSLAYRLDYKKNTFLIGLQPGIGFYNLNKVFTHPDQFNYETGNFDSELPTNDILDKDSRIFADFALGLNWSRPIAGFFPHIGLAMYHVNKPKNSLYSYDSESRIPVKTLISFNLPLTLTSRMEISPSALIIRQRKSQELIIGVDGIYSTKENSEMIDNIYTGIHYRNARSEGLSSLVFLGGLKIDNIRLGISYDSYFNAARNSSSIGSSFEISIIYTGIDTFTDKFSIPCEIY